MADIKFGRLTFKAVDKAYAPIYVRWMSDPEIIQNMGVPMGPFSLQDEEAFVENELKKPINERSMAIFINDGEHGEEKLIGNCGFVSIDRNDNSGELGLLIGEKSYWNMGYGTEAIRALIWHGFYNLGLHRIWLCVLDPNKGGIRAYEKAGMRHEGTFREAHYQQGRFVDIHIMAILRQEWDEQQARKDNA